MQVDKISHKRWRGLNSTTDYSVLKISVLSVENVNSSSSYDMRSLRTRKDACIMKQGYDKNYYDITPNVKKVEQIT